MRISIVVATRNEAPTIADTLRRLRALAGDCELIVADGGSEDGTRELAAPLARMITCPPGRARQLNAGARATSGDVLWFVHADSVPDFRTPAMIRAALADPATVGGGCAIRFDRETLALRALARASNLRARALGEIYGDQAMFVRRSVFDALGGFPELPLMEDLEFSHRLARRGRLVLLPAPVTASARRFTAHGTLRMVAFMQYLKLRYYLGADPRLLRDRYESGPGLRLGSPHRPRRVPLR